MDIETIDLDAWFDSEDNNLLDEPIDQLNNIQRPPSPPPALQAKDILLHIQILLPPLWSKDYLALGLNKEDSDYFKEVLDSDTLSQNELAFLNSEPATYTAVTCLEDWNV